MLSCFCDLPVWLFIVNFALSKIIMSMANITASQKQDWAKTLFIKENLTQGEIAERVGVARATVNRWVKAGKWEELKAGITLTSESQIAALYAQVAELNKKISSKPDGCRFPDASEANILSQITANIKKLQKDASLEDVISVLTRFVGWVRPVDLDMAKKIGRLADAFINEQL